MSDTAPVDPSSLELQWHVLLASNGERMSRLAQQGVQVDHVPTVILAWLEAILTAVGGSDAVIAARVMAMSAVAELLDNAERQVARARLIAPPNGNHP